MQSLQSFEKAKTIFSLPLLELIYKAHSIHLEHFAPNTIQINSILSIKTGACQENCAYCNQSAHHHQGTKLKKEDLIETKYVIEAAKKAKAAGSTRLCMAAAWRSPKEKELAIVCEMIGEVKKLGLEACVTLGILDDSQIFTLKQAGLDFYNHNINTSPELHHKIVTTHTFQDRLDTLNRVRRHGIKVCCGGILGMGETNEDRIKMLLFLANLDPPPESVPINRLIKFSGTPLGNKENIDIDPFDFIRAIALARILMPKSYVKLSAGRENMSDELQALCFMAGANSIFYGEKLLTADHVIPERDDKLFKKLGLNKAPID